MKTKTIITLFLLLMVSTPSVFGQNSAFSGAWKLDNEKTTIADELYLERITIRLTGDSLFTTRVYTDGYEEYFFDENLSLDGKESKIYIYDMPRTSKASRSTSDGSLAVESKTIFYSDYGEETMAAKETWKVDKDGKTLTIGFTNSMSGVNTTGTNYYNKVK